MKSGKQKASAERVVKDIRRKTRRQHSAEEKIRIVLKGFVMKTALPNCATEKE
ncbi:hypothetical protein RUA4292_03194 [Ruegeria atlantica]|uniref:Uncharacterized protein n=1 Tax=Ruegeria atlantica TaxID=81569 RepID=A0A0P1EGH1_9RHOB|nr:hypothetical protein RUA4292_03194 [Ruegeria atlantica]